MANKVKTIIWITRNTGQKHEVVLWMGREVPPSDHDGTFIGGDGGGFSVTMSTWAAAWLFPSLPSEGNILMMKVKTQEYFPFSSGHRAGEA